MRSASAFIPAPTKPLSSLETVRVGLRWIAHLGLNSEDLLTAADHQVADTACRSKSTDPPYPSYPLRQNREGFRPPHHRRRRRYPFVPPAITQPLELNAVAHYWTYLNLAPLRYLRCLMSIIPFHPCPSVVKTFLQPCGFSRPFLRYSFNPINRSVLLCLLRHLRFSAFSRFWFCGCESAFHWDQLAVVRVSFDSGLNL